MSGAVLWEAVGDRVERVVLCPPVISEGPQTSLGLQFKSTLWGPLTATVKVLGGHREPLSHSFSTVFFSGDGSEP